MKTDIDVNTTPLTLEDDLILTKLKAGSAHSLNRKALFIDTDSGLVYAADSLNGGGESSYESMVPYNQSMVANYTAYDGDLACPDNILIQPEGRVDVTVNGVQVTIGEGKEGYFSGDDGLTARVRGTVEVGDKFYWNGSIAGYELDPNDTIDFDYLMSDSVKNAPIVDVILSNGIWGAYLEGSLTISATDYSEPPLESWEDIQDPDNYLKLYVSESSTQLINICQICVDGVVQTNTILTPIGEIAEHDKKIVDALFGTYVVNGRTINISRGVNWASFSL